MPSKVLTLLILGTLLFQYALCHDEEEEEDNLHHMAPLPAAATNTTSPPNYLRYPHHAAWIYAHISLMILSWVFILPIMVMLRIARSRHFTGTSQLAFHVVNLAGLLTGRMYNASTPNLYPCNVHGVMGWIGTLWAIVSSVGWLYTSCARVAQDGRRGVQFECDGGSKRQRWLRGLRELVLGRRQSRYTPLDVSIRKNSSSDDDDTESIQSLEKHDPAYDSSSAETLCAEPNKATKPLTLISIFGTILNRSLLPVGFIICVSGFVVYSGNFRSLEVYGGLSHWIKGGIFFWIGLLTMGRWIGAFADLGWAWNVKPTHNAESGRWKEKVPSLEFVESFLIWLYGASNVFLEHLSNWGGEWSAVDFEHISITVLFFGGGLLGMVVEAGFVQRLVHRNDDVNRDISRTEEDEDSSDSKGAFAMMEGGLTTQPNPEKRRTISLNPIPSLTIGLLGLMMASHHQHTALGAAIHSQWGYLFFGAALSRLATLISLYHKSPTAYPSRPITELITAFCLTGGGMLFMMSGRDSIAGLEANKIVAMTAFTGTMGLAAAVLSWEVVVFGVKGWVGRSR